MVRCADFYEKWKRDPNWCEKSPKAVEQIDHYLALVDEIAEEQADPIAIYKLFPERVAREVFKLKGDERSSVITNTAGMIKRGEKVSTQDINAWLGIETKPKSTPIPDDEDRTIVPNTSPVPDVKQKVSVIQDEDGYIENRPFKTALEAQNHTFDPIVPPAPSVASVDPAKQRREEMEALAVELLGMYSPAIQTMVTDIMREHPSYKVKDVFYFGVQALAERKKP